jgi:hypothetical protein
MAGLSARPGDFANHPVVGRPRPGARKDWRGAPARAMVDDRMDQDPELDVTLSDGLQVATFQIAALGGVREAWAIVEPRMLPCVIRGCAAALAARDRLDQRIAARLAAGWVPLDRRPLGAPRVAPAALPPDLVLQISSLLEGLTRARHALRGADPSGQLWAACQVFRQQAWRFGVGTPHARVLRARQERRLGELAEQAGDRAAAILHYRLALASFARVGVTRRLRRLEAHGHAATPPDAPSVRPAAPAPRPASSRGPRREAGTSRVRHRIACMHASRTFDLTVRGNRAVMCARASRPHPPLEASMKGRVQIVGRLPVELNRRVRAVAKKRKVSLNAFLIQALTQALGLRQVAASKEPR